MSQIIPNEESFIGFLVGDDTNRFGVADVDHPTVAEIGAAVDLTDFIIQITPTSTGNTVPVPRLKRRFEPSIDGTSTASFTADLYRDDEDDLAWTTLPRKTKGAWFIKRFGGTGVDLKPVAGETVEVWPTSVTSRAGSGMQSGQAQTFTLTCSVPEEPNEDAVVAA